MSKRIKVLALLTCAFALQNVTISAIPKSDTKDKGTEVSDFYFDIGSLGGVTTSETNEVKLFTKVNSVSNPQAKDTKIKEQANPSPTVKVNTQVETADTFYGNSDVVINEVHQEDLRIEAERKRKEQLASIAWLSEYGVDIEQLSTERINVLNEGKKWIGSWYVWGGTIPPQGSDWTYGNGGGGFDCSGYTRYVLRTALGIELPRTTYEQIGSSYFTRVPISEAMPGDIVFNGSVSHTGFFIKDNGSSIYMLHSPETGKKIQISTYRRPAYVYRYVQ